MLKETLLIFSPAVCRRDSLLAKLKAYSAIGIFAITVNTFAQADNSSSQLRPSFDARENNNTHKIQLNSPGIKEKPHNSSRSGTGGRSNTRLDTVETLALGRGPLTSSSDQPIETIVKHFLINKSSTLGLNPLTEVDSGASPSTSGEDQYTHWDYKISSQSENKEYGTTRVYLQQFFKGYPVYNASMMLNIDNQGRVINVINQFAPYLSGTLKNLEIKLDAAAAITTALESLAYENIQLQASASQNNQYLAEGLVKNPINPRLMILPLRQGESRWVWRFNLELAQEISWLDMTIDASSGKIWTQHNQTLVDAFPDQSQSMDKTLSINTNAERMPAHGENTDSEFMISLSPWQWSIFNVYPLPLESPAQGSREYVFATPNPLSSPMGWFEEGTSSTIGNNAEVYYKGEENYYADCRVPRICDFDFDPEQANGDFINAMLSQAFYTVNKTHDILHRHGFNESAGNFQNNNFDRGGIGGDHMKIFADPNKSNNATAFISGDGPGRNEIHGGVWDATGRHALMDAGILIHEYTHGVSMRLVGGPQNGSCMYGVNSKALGEGISDLFAMVLTATPGDSDEHLRTIGSYVSDNEQGLRTYPYTTDTIANPFTFQSIADDGMAEEHAQGSVYATALWRVYRSLVAINHYGYNPYWPRGQGRHATKRMLTYMIEAMKNSPCKPTFLEFRNAFIRAVETHPKYAEKDLCPVWDAFAAFGAGTDASGSFNNDPSNGSLKPETSDCRGHSPIWARVQGLQNVPEGYLTEESTLVTYNMGPDRESILSCRYELDGQSTVLNDCLSGEITLESLSEDMHSFELFATRTDGVETSLDLKEFGVVLNTQCPIDPFIVHENKYMSHTDCVCAAKALCSPHFPWNEWCVNEAQEVCDPSNVMPI